MKNRGFTLVEVLAVIVILTIIMAIAISIITNIIYDARLNAFAADEHMMTNASKIYMSMNDSYLPSDQGDTIEVKLSILQDDDLISSIINPWDNNDICDGYILVTKVSSSKYDYTPYLKCNNNYKAGDYKADGLEASWKFDGNAYDYTPNNNQGIIKNVTTTANRFGTLNTALKFNGPSNFVDTNYNYGLNYNTSTTFSLWVKFSTNDTGGKIKNIFGKNSWEYILSQVDNKIQFTAWNDSGSYAVRLISNTNVQVGQWYNITLVYDSSTKQMYLYINGLIDNFSSILGMSFANRNESLKIGRGYPDTGAASSTFFLGVIDNFSIYSRALLPSEIKLNYNLDQLMKR